MLLPARGLDFCIRSGARVRSHPPPGGVNSFFAFCCCVFGARRSGPGRAPGAPAGLENAPGYSLTVLLPARGLDFCTRPGAWVRSHPPPRDRELVFRTFVGRFPVFGGGVDLVTRTCSTHRAPDTAVNPETQRLGYSLTVPLPGGGPSIALCPDKTGARTQASAVVTSSDAKQIRYGWDLLTNHSTSG